MLKEHYQDGCNGICNQPWLHVDSTTCSIKCELDNGGFCWLHGVQQLTLFARSFRAKYPKEYAEQQARKLTKRVTVPGRGPLKESLTIPGIEIDKDQFNLGVVQQQPTEPSRRRRSSKVNPR